MAESRFSFESYYSFNVLLFNNQYCDSVDRAIDAAENEVSLRQLAKHRIPKITQSFEATTACAKRPVEQQVQDVPQGARRPPGPRNWGEGYGAGSCLQLIDRLCYICNQPGHLARNSSARQAPASNQETVVTCFNCNGIGHQAYLCPSSKRKGPPAKGNPTSSSPALAITTAHFMAYARKTTHANYDLHANVYIRIGQSA
uniref:CCHC-type domain-containing protein n=1 Tax=Romanomermis culicivorax TaxID=13658 RepID=A0A915KWM0_ROMCU